MPTAVQGIGPAQGISELYNLVGKMPLSVDSTIVPVVSVGDLDKEVTWGPLAFATLDLGATVLPLGNRWEIALPIANQTVGMRALVETVWITPGADTNVHIVPSPGLPAPNQVSVKAWADTRRRGLPQVLLNGRDNANLLGIVGVIIRRCPMNVLQEFVLNWIIGANPDTGVMQGIYFESTSTLCGITCTVAWREGAPR